MKKMSRRLKMVLAMATTFGLGVAMTACSSGSASGSSSASKQFTLGIMINDMTNPFLASMASTEQKEAAKYGMKTIVLNGDLNNQTEISDVNDLLTKHVNALLLTPSDPTAILPAIASANAQNVPVFTVNTTADNSAKIVSHIGESDYTYGVGLGNLTVEATGGKGNIAVLLGVIGDSPEVQRLAGLKSVLAKHPDIKIVTTEVDNWVNQTNLAATQDILSKYPAGQLSAIVAQGPEMYVGANWAAKNGRSDVKMIAGDFSKEVKSAIEAGTLYGTINQDPTLEGQLAIQQAYYYLSGQKDKVKANVSIPLPLVTKKNVDQYTSTWDS